MSSDPCETLTVHENIVHMYRIDIPGIRTLYSITLYS